MGARPPGHIPPLPRAELHRGRALVAAASDRHDTVEDELSAAVELYETLGYPYLLAQAQADLGAWLIDRDRLAEALEPLRTARRAFERLGAAPPRDRARHLLDSAAGDQAEQDAGVPNASARSSAQGQLGAPLC
jgi:hypothetical protein